VIALGAVSDVTMASSRARVPARLLGLLDALAKDTDACEAEVKRTGSGLAKRNFVRALFAWIEAVSYLMRQHVLREACTEVLTEKSMPTLLAASERSFYIDGKGDVVEQPLKTRTSNLLLFSLKSFAERLGLSLTVDKGGRNWQAYTQALEIRDRLTHPKASEDLELTERDIEVVREAKGMIIGYIAVFSRPSLVAHINEMSQEAKANGIWRQLTLTEDDLKRFGVGEAPNQGPAAGG